MAAIFYTLATLKDKLQSADKERGATAIEYALIIGLVSIGLVVALLVLGIDEFVKEINTWIDGRTVGS